LTAEQSQIEPIKAALIGCGAVAMRGLIPGWLPLTNPNRPQPVSFLNFGYASGLIFTAICDNDPENLTRTQEILPEAAPFRSWPELRSTITDLQAVIISTPIFLHEEMVLDAVDLGCDVFVEKPLALTHEGLDRVANAASNSGRIVMVHLPWSFSPAAHEIFGAVREGCLGEIKTFKAEFRHSGPKAWSPGAEWYYGDGNPGGAWTDLGSHVLDLLCKVMPSKEIRTFRCRPKIIHRWVERAECQVVFKDNCTATLIVGWDSDTPVFRLNLVGTQGQLNAELIGPGRVECITKERCTRADRCLKTIDVLSPFAHFVSCVRTRVVPETGVPRVLTSERLVVEGLRQLLYLQSYG
jgi:predicted dehydrogenase